MGLFSRDKVPIFLKQESDSERQLQSLRQLMPKLNKEGQQIIERDIKLLEYGIQGEKNIEFELKNSHIPMCVLHDIYLEADGLNAQIDYIVITKKLTFVIECKNLYGDIEVNNNGEFVRTISYGGRKKKEGIYSPIVQNRRHLDLLKKINTDAMSNVVIKFMSSHYFDNFYKGIVVLANPRTVVNMRYAKKEIKDQVIRADQLINYIKDACKESKELSDSQEEMEKLAKRLLSFHKDVQHNYTKKYEPYYIGTENAKNDDMALEETKSYKELKAFRLQRSREEKIKPYYIFNDAQLKELLIKKPKTKTELLKISGFGQVKVEKYGDEILKLIT